MILTVNVAFPSPTRAVGATRIATPARNNASGNVEDLGNRMSVVRLLILALALRITLNTTMTLLLEDANNLVMVDAKEVEIGSVLLRNVRHCA